VYVSDSLYTATSQPLTPLRACGVRRSWRQRAIKPSSAHLQPLFQATVISEKHTGLIIFYDFFGVSPPKLDRFGCNLVNER